LEIEGIPFAQWQDPVDFERLTAMHPTARIVLGESTKPVPSRLAQLIMIAPLGRGQRGLIVAPPRTRKTILLKDIAQAIIHEQPRDHSHRAARWRTSQEVTDFKRAIPCEIYSSTFDETHSATPRSQKWCWNAPSASSNSRKHVVILLDSITRLSRGYNNMQPGKGRVMSGGVDTKALVKPEEVFRCCT